MDRPRPDEYASYYGAYIARVGEGNLVNLLRTQIADTRGFVEGLTEEDALFRYAPEKWSIKETIGHIADTERVMAYRALRVARGDRTPLPGFDENLFVREASFDARPLAALIADFAAVRESSIHLFTDMPSEVTARMGEASGHPVSVRALAYIIAGHELHHRALLIERYGLG